LLHHTLTFRTIAFSLPKKVILNDAPDPDNAPETGGVAVDLRNVTKSFGGVSAVRGVTFAIAPGEVVALAGENGAGKSTIKNLIGGILRADSGDITVFDAPQ
jgi:ABC-type sugar transport system ATPase subunit